MRCAPVSPLPTLLALGVFIGCVGPGAQDPESHAEDPAASVDDRDLRATGLSDMTAAIRDGRWGNIHAVVITRNGRVVYEEYFAGEDERLGRSLGRVEFDAESLHDVRSISKTVTATLIGIALARGEIASVDVPLAQLLPRHEHLLTGDKARITLRHVLTMSAGLEWDEESVSYLDPKNDESRLSRSPDPLTFVLGRDLVSKPGEVFNYSGGLTHVLASVLQGAVGVGIDDYAEATLFRSLGITHWDWMDSGAARPSAFSGLRLRAGDVAKLGQLYLDRGRWDGKRLVEPEWIEEATRTQVVYDDPEAPAFVVTNGYGYQWWTNRYTTGAGELSVATAIGNGEQRVIVIPGLSLVVAVLAGFYNEPGHSWVPEQMLMQYVVPSIRN